MIFSIFNLFTGSSRRERETKQASAAAEQAWKDKWVDEADYVVIETVLDKNDQRVSQAAFLIRFLWPEFLSACGDAGIRLATYQAVSRYFYDLPRHLTTYGQENAYDADYDQAGGFFKIRVHRDDGERLIKVFYDTHEKYHGSSLASQRYQEYFHQGRWVK